MKCNLFYNRLCNRHLSHLKAFFHSSAVVWKVLETPSIEEVFDMLKRFPKPKRVINQLFTPFIEANQNNGFQVENVVSLKGRAWKTHLHFKWPQVFTVTGQSKTQEQAEENAYLIACDVYKYLGVLSNGKVENRQSLDATCGQHYLLPQLEKVGNELSLESIFQFLYTCANCEDGLIRWSSELHISHPFKVTTLGKGLSQDAAHQIACLNACIKLKFMGFLSSGNSIDIAKIKRRYQTEQYVWVPPPDYALFVDASMIGYGALLTPTSTSHQARWIADTWPDEVTHISLRTEKNYVAFLEFYAAVTAVYTWKHKFFNKHILIWSDNEQVVHLVNSDCARKRAIEDSCGKILQVLRETCKKHNISVRAQHVSRLDNVAADILSKLDLEKFRAVVPDASMKPKKAKKLLFFLPFKDENT